MISIIDIIVWLPRERRDRVKSALFKQGSPSSTKLESAGTLVIVCQFHETYNICATSTWFRIVLCKISGSVLSARFAVRGSRVKSAGRG